MWNTYNLSKKGCTDDDSQNHWNLLVGHVAFEFYDFLKLGEEDVGVGSNEGRDGGEETHRVDQQLRSHLQAVTHTHTWYNNYVAIRRFSNKHTNLTLTQIG